MKKITVLLLQLLIMMSCYAQNDTGRFSIPDNLLLEQWQNNFEQYDESQLENIADALSEDLDALLQNNNVKYNLNDLSAEIAFSVLKMSAYQYYQLQLYITEYGQLYSIYELMAVDGFSKEDFLLWAPILEARFVMTSQNFFRNFFKRSKNQFLVRYSRVLEKQRGYEQKEGGYLGSPFRLSFRYKFSTQDKFFIALSGEKDAGEQFFKGTQKKGFDFYSFNIFIHNVGIIKSAVVGDYKMNLGQGLVMGNALMSGKGGGVEAVRKFQVALRPSAPLNESSDLHGAAVELGNRQWTTTLFYSRRFFDGSIIDTGELYFDGTISLSGLYRTENEIKKRHSLHADVVGADLTYKSALLKIGIRTLYSRFSSYVIRGEPIYKKYDFDGINAMNVGIDYQAIIGKHILFGECAVDKKGAVAVLQGAILNLVSVWKMSVLARYYAKDYFALCGRAFGVNSSNKNEIGLYVTSRFLLFPKLTMFVYSDFYYFPWLRFRVDAPSKGNDLGVSLLYDVSRKCTTSFSYHYKSKQQNGDELLHVKQLINTKDHHVRLMFSYSPTSSFELKTSFQLRLVHAALQTDHINAGLLLYQDFKYRFQKPSLSLYLRLAVFDTDSYDERLYAYENDLYYAFTISAYYYQGIRYYLMLKYQYRFIAFWLRFSRTEYSNKTTVGSGLDLIAAPHKMDIRFQTVVNF